MEPGSFKHTNHLVHATSPYLLQHAHNPVDWYPWGAEALAKARREDKPIFLSIGYSACHWCHVMERESFEDERIAALLNAHFVSIKVDREERPDLDEIYMHATMLFNRGQGGWPMTVFLTADQKPFFAGTYYPPDARYGRPGFKQLLEGVVTAWREKRASVLDNAESLSQAVERYVQLVPSDDGVPRSTVAQVADRLAELFDPQRGGLASGGSNKFPPSMAMHLMLRESSHARRAGRPKPDLLRQVTRTLERMAAGGIYDQLGGGIARYSTDPDWLVPHFEKMLYDQALVSGVYLDAYLLTGRRDLAAVAEDIFQFVIKNWQAPEGGFYSSLDADSEGQEGKYYVWSREEILRVLGDQDGAWFCDYFNVTDAGNWEGHNILHVTDGLDVVAKRHNLPPAEMKTRLDQARRKMLAARGARVPPGLDDKILTSWNGLMIASLARGGRLFAGNGYTAAATKAARFILTGMSREGRLLRTSRAGKAHIPAYLDDYAFFIEALLNLYETTFEPRWLDEAARLADVMIARFWDDRQGAFFYTADDAEDLMVRTKDARDGAVPSGNSVALLDLLRLALVYDRQDLCEKADRLIRAFAGSVAQSPFGYERFLQAIDFKYGRPREIVVAGPAAAADTRALLEVIRHRFDPNRVVLQLDPTAGDAAAWSERIPLLREKTPIAGKATVYVCRNATCKRPVTTPAELAALLDAD